MLDMIKCSTGGAYYARGEWVPADGNASAALAAKGFDAAAVANAKTGTMAYSILQAHNTSGDADNLKIKFDAMASHDITFDLQVFGIAAEMCIRDRAKGRVAQIMGQADGLGQIFVEAHWTCLLYTSMPRASSAAYSASSPDTSYSCSSMARLICSCLLYTSFRERRLMD